MGLISCCLSTAGPGLLVGLADTDNLRLLLALGSAGIWLAVESGQNLAWEGLSCGFWLWLVAKPEDLFMLCPVWVLKSGICPVGSGWTGLWRNGKTSITFLLWVLTGFALGRRLSETTPRCFGFLALGEAHRRTKIVECATNASC